MNSLCMCGVGAWLCAASLAGAGGREVRLESLDLSGVEQEWGVARADKSVDNHPISIGGKVFEHGVGTHAASDFDIDLGGEAERFRAMVGVDDDACAQPGTVVFVVRGDDRELSRTPVVRGKEPARALDVDVRGVKVLTLSVEDAGDGITCDHADWADAVIVMAEGAKGGPRAGRGMETQVQIAPAEKGGRPRLGWPRVFGASVGKPVLFRVPARAESSPTETIPGPVRFWAKGLPEGVVLDGATGVITGTLSHPGTTSVRVTVAYVERSTEEWVDEQTFTIVCGPEAVAATPPMGWNSWNCWATAVDDRKVRGAIDAMVSSGLAAHGYRDVNIDDAWEGGRDAAGRIQSNKKFPDMKALADYAHSKGLKLGIYSSPGPKTCAGYEGSYEHERLDAEQYAAWGIDYLKYDWCSYGSITPRPDTRKRADLMKPYEVMRDALRAQSRDIFFSLCQYGMGNVWEWGASVGGNCWRTTDDINDSWRSMSGIGFSQGAHAPFAGPGHWNDPDMLVVGRVGWGPSLHDSKLTHNEQVTHITLWAMLAAPLLIGCDLTQMDDFTLALLTNDDVIAVDQDELGKPAMRVGEGSGGRKEDGKKPGSESRGTQGGGTEVWSRPLVGGGMAVAFFNRGRGDAKVSVTRAELGIAGSAMVRDAWMRKDLGALGEEIAVVVPRHGAMLYVILPGK